LTHHLTRNRLAETWALKERFQEITAGCNGRIVERINTFCAEILGNRQVPDGQMQSEWTSLMKELRRLHGLTSYLKTVEDTCSLIRDSGAPKWALKLESYPVTQTVDEFLPGAWAQAWRLRRLSTYLDSIDVRKDLQNLSVVRSEAETDLARAYQDVVSKRTWHKLASNATPTVRQALAAFSNAISKIGKGTGKRAVRYRQDARLAAAQANSAIPCWIMPHYRVSESLPPELGVFDLVIIDEASQSDLTALPAILRAKKVLIVGDDKQVSPEGVGIEEDKIRNLMTRFLGGQVETFRAQMTPERSIYDLCKVVFAEYSVMLKEHFRCVSPIIEYSKREFYNNELKPLRLPSASERLDPPLIDVFVEDGFTHKTDNTNHAEARFIVDEILAICADPKMNKRSIGVVSLLGDKQALKIWHMLEDELGPEQIEKFKIACGDARTFQGKEKDIMFLSMVVAPNSTITALSRDTFSQRFNVAASRARDRMYLVRSAGLEDLSDKDKLRRGLITHFVHPFAQDDQRVDDLRELCESPFERDVYDELTGRGYRVIPQVRVGDFRIDMVVEGHHDARLAVECDGDRYHGPDRWDADINRQRILERAGWTFWRCFASAFVMHRKDVLQDLVNTLSKRGIEPIGAENAPRSVYTEFRTYSLSKYQDQPLEFEDETFDSSEMEVSLLPRSGEVSSVLQKPLGSEVKMDFTFHKNESINPAEKLMEDVEVIWVGRNGNPIEDSEKLVVQVGDHITYIDLSDPEVKNHVQIVSGQDNFEAGIINETRPLAQALLDMAEDDEVELSVPGRPIHSLKILRIVKERRV
jgi:very-short-patch-repair endonuclease/transcription elongation GreA/GreB family factor